MAKRRRSKPKELPNKSELERLYLKERKSLQAIGRIYSVGAKKIREHLVNQGIKIIPRGSWALGLTKETHSGIKKSAESKKGVTRTLETIEKIKKSGTMFEKNHIPWIKGKHHSEKTKIKLSKANKGKSSPNKGKKGPPSPFKGQTKETNLAIKKRSISATGKKRTNESKQKMSKAATRKFKDNPQLKEKISKSVSKANMKPKRRKELQEQRAKQKFPFKDSKPELLTQSILKDHGINFKKHKNFRLRKSNHQADIIIEPNHIIEIFGDYWHFNPKKYDGESIQKVRHREIKVKEVWEYDRYVIDGMKEQGYKVLVVWESELKDELEKTTKKILRFVKA